MTTATASSPLAAKAMRQMFQLLEDNFDAEQGAYLHGYSDERVARECEISAAAVKHHRTLAFGKLKPPTELAVLNQEVEELQKLALQTDAEMRAKIKEINARISAIARKFD